MEDAATAEISRTQVWQWLKNNVKLDDGRLFNRDLYKEFLSSEVATITTMLGEENNKNSKLSLAISLFDELVLSEEFEEFLTVPAYQYI
tara:strand:+ start:270 stop:536 length:267 start_codon:yes stop_codon:yes gene_type:complete